MKKFSFVILLTILINFCGCAWLATHAPSITPEQTTGIANVAAGAASTAVAAAAATNPGTAPVSGALAGAAGAMAFALVGWVGTLYTNWKNKYQIVAKPTTPSTGA